MRIYDFSFRPAAGPTINFLAIACSVLVACLIFNCSSVAVAQTKTAEQEATQKPQSKKEKKAAAKKPAKKKTPRYATESHNYKTVGKRKLMLYVTKPANWLASDQRPAAVFFHGGGWVGGAPGQFDEHSKHLADRGMVSIQVEYRLLGKNRKSKKAAATAPADAKPEIAEDKTPTNCIHDAKSAMRWVRSHATELGIDPNRIASGGGSAGGHLAAFIGTTDGTDDPADDQTVSARSNAMLLFNPVYDNGPGGWGTARVGERFQEFSPAHNISSDDVPAIVLLGTEDKLIPVETARNFQSKMKEVGLKSDLHLYEGAGHGFFNFGKEAGKWYKLTVAEMDKFLVELGWLEKLE